MSDTAHAASRHGKLRGVAAALAVWERVGRGAVISESLRGLGDRVSPADRKLAASLCYALARRLSLWEYLRSLYMLPKPSKFSRAAQTAVLVGIAGLAELKHFAPAVLISSLIDWTKERDPRGARVVNAVLRRALENAPTELARLEADSAREGTEGLESLCLVNGVPQWVGERWCAEYGEYGRKLVRLNAAPAAMSLRLSPDAPRDIAERLRAHGLPVLDSPLPEGLRIDGTPLPTALEGYAEGCFTPQSESSIIVGGEAADFDGALLLDMCAGRGVKTGQIAQLRPDITIEAWDLSAGRAAAGARDMERLGVAGRVSYKTGNALDLSPDAQPDAILVDAPCSGSGTWRRHPEGKWRLTQENLAALAELQTQILSRAFSLVKAGGKVVYSTCSLLSDENEKVVSRALERFPDVRTLDFRPPEGAQPRTHGCVLLPDNPWTDGFYIAEFTK